MRLGALIVRELGIDKGNDTLGRWMAHHLAELIAEAEGTEGDEITEVRDHIVDLILRVWSRRRSFPRGKNPLSDLEDLASLLWRLRPEASPFRRLGSNETEDLLASAFSQFQRVVIYGILMISGINTVPEKVEDFEPHFDEHELELIQNARRWIEGLNTDKRRDVQIEFVSDASSVAKAPSEQPEVAEELHLQLVTKRLLGVEIDELIEALSTLKSRIASNDNA